MEYLVRLRDDRGSMRVLKAVIQSDEEGVELARHSHILEVFGAVKFKATKEQEREFQPGGCGFVEITEPQAEELLGGGHTEAPTEEEVVVEAEEDEPKNKSKNK